MLRTQVCEDSVIDYTLVFFSNYFYLQSFLKKNLRSDQEVAKTAQPATEEVKIRS